MTNNGPDTGLDIVTGAFSYSGKYITRLLHDQGRSVRTITAHPNHADPFAGRVEAVPYRFDDPAALARSLDGATTLYNTYWVRFKQGSITFETAVENSRILFEAARAAGITRIVHVSIANPSIESPLPYYSGKAKVEQLLAETGVGHSIVRPTVAFGNEDVLINNIAWFIRKLHLFAIPGSGDYPIQPVHVEDLARICVESSTAPSGTVVDAVGPETMTFNELIGLVRNAIGTRALVFHTPPRVAQLGAQTIGKLLGDTVLTREEVAGLTAGLLAVDGPAAGRISFRGWLEAASDTIGTEYANEIHRHFAPVSS